MSSWEEVFDVYGVKRVAPNDKKKSAYVPNNAQKEALERGGVMPTDGGSGSEVSIRVLGDSERTRVRASYYHSKGHPQRERRIGREFVSRWLNDGDQVLIGVRDGQVFAAKIQNTADHPRILSELLAITSGNDRSGGGRVRPISDDGRQLKAEFSIEGQAPAFTLTVECGDGRVRTEYAEALELLLTRLATLSAKLVSGRLVTAVALHRAATENMDTALRPVPFSLPLELRASDASDLRKALGRAGAAIGRPEGTSGNTTKRIALELVLNHEAARTAGELQALLVGESEIEDAKGLGGIDPADALVLASPVDEKALETLRQKYASASPLIKAKLSHHVERGGVGAKVKSVRGFRCQICEALGVESLGFEKRSGGRYVEAHHVMPVSELVQGSLGPQNVIAVCPNHHRQIHYGKVIVTEREHEFVLLLDGMVLTVERN